MSLTDAEAKTLALEVNEVIPASIVFYSLNTEDKALVIKHFLDGLIGTDETAVISNIPGISPALTESLTDGVLDVVANALAKYLNGDVVE